ncbi:MAG: S41 family peptidase [Tannerella sp.]|jgi:carboxyl-terminal processing protease|nr:S41 family peptidase [Tannerella sp.]
MNRNRHFLWATALIAVSLILGFYAGKYYRIMGPQFNMLRSGQNKVNEALDVISRHYVDTVDVNRLSESAVNKIVSELDPHSAYIPAPDVEAANEDLEASFSGIGIQFNMPFDTILVISVISGGPAEKAGLMPFDRIITVDDSLVAGRELGTTKIMRMLRGPKDSKVRLGIQRGNAGELAQFELTRGDIPNQSIDVSYKVHDDIGYIKITKFSRSTYKDFLTAIAKLRDEGAKGFIIDLRDNPGGYMESAINVINEFLPKGRLIVYMKGRSYPRTDSYSNGKGTCQDAPLVVLINELSGSASEIFSGAIQDNDRGTIIGRRSYGKGLVQTKLDLSDRSELLLTIARYYTPSGRCIQKDYELGNAEEYSHDLYNRYMHGEYYSADSIKMNDSLEYKTAGRRTVYGGGGVMPDIFIPRDTTGMTSYYSSVVNTGVLYQFALDYSDKNQERLSSFDTYGKLHEYLQQQPIIQEFADFAASKGIRKRPTLINISKNLIETQLYAFIVRNFFDYEGFYPILFKDDPTLNKAIEVISEGRWKPELIGLYEAERNNAPLYAVEIPGRAIKKPLYAETGE